MRLTNLSALLLVSTSFAAETLVSDVASFEKAAGEAKAGDVIVLKEGEWKDARLVLRASGTEPLVRVMVEAAEEDLARRAADDLAAVVRRRLA